jgi:hypothetical protein
MGKRPRPLGSKGQQLGSGDVRARDDENDEGDLSMSEVNTTEAAHGSDSDQGAVGR